MNCPKCQAPNLEGANFCKSCRAPLPKISEAKIARCPNGHTIDPTWGICPVCIESAEERESSLNRRQGAAIEQPSPLMQAPRRKTLVEEDSDYKKPPALPTTIENIQQIVSPPPSAPPLEKSGRRKTVIASTQNLGDKPPLQGQKNKLVAFLLTYSIDPMGQYYEVREGRHIIGGGERADIFIPNDSLMSSEHAILLYRRGRFFFQDNLSTNGSFINGQEAVGQIKLNNYDEITVGSTTLRLVMAQEEKSKEQEEKGGVDVSGEA